ncbi:hypothetical protein C8Q79DRAFT_1104778 [Trametes meyenii]|nr:hypothetical protein C8Q79DRAFT_1104778 [Trametes meyenii]
MLDVTRVASWPLVDRKSVEGGNAPKRGINEEFMFNYARMLQEGLGDETTWAGMHTCYCKARVELLGDSSCEEREIWHPDLMAKIDKIYKVMLHVHQDNFGLGLGRRSTPSKARVREEEQSERSEDCDDATLSAGVPVIPNSSDKRCPLPFKAMLSHEHVTGTLA